MDEGDLFVDELQKLSSRAPSEAGGHDDGGRGTHVVGYSERMKMRGLSEATEEIDRHFRAGAHMVMVGYFTVGDTDMCDWIERHEVRDGY